MKTKFVKITLLLFMAALLSFTVLSARTDAYFNAYAYGPYFPVIDPLYVYSPFGYSPLALAPVIPYRGADALLTTLTLLGALPSTSTSISSTSTIGTTTALLLGGSSTSSLLLASTLATPTTTSYPTYSYPTYSYPSTSYSTSSTGIGISTALLLGGSTSTTTLLALGI